VSDQVDSHLLLLPPFLALDVWYLRQSTSAGPFWNVAAGSLLAAGVGLTVSLPAIANWLPTPAHHSRDPGRRA
jgi:hypothetical protein